MSWTRIRAILLRHLYEAKHNSGRLADMFIFPLIEVVVWGFISVYLAEQNVGLAISLIIGAVITWLMFNLVQQDLGIGLMEDVWSKNLLNLFASPLALVEYVIGLILMSFVKVIVSVGLASVVAWFLYQYSIFSLSFYFLPFLFNLLVFALIFGLFNCALIIRFSTKIQALAWTMSAIIQPFSAVIYPVSVLPKAWQVAAWLFPTSHVFEGMRYIIFQNGFDYYNFWWGFILNIVYLILVVKFLGVAFAYAKKNGLLVHLN